MQACFARTEQQRQIVVVGCESDSGLACFDVQTRSVCERLAIDAGIMSDAGDNAERAQMALAVASSKDLRTLATGTAGGSSSAVLVWRATGVTGVLPT